MPQVVLPGGAGTINVPTNSRSITVAELSRSIPGLKSYSVVHRGPGGALMQLADTDFVAPTDVVQMFPTNTAGCSCP